jgi:hypothetical protein
MRRTNEIALAVLSDNGESAKELKVEPEFLNLTTHCGPDCTTAATMRRSTESTVVAQSVLLNSRALLLSHQRKSADIIANRMRNSPSHLLFHHAK